VKDAGLGASPFNLLPTPHPNGCELFNAERSVSLFVGPHEMRRLHGVAPAEEAAKAADVAMREALREKTIGIYWGDG
jgi:hypothetical protein